MAYEDRGAGALDYYPCRYGRSRLVFRGPRRGLDRAYIAMLGGSETYGRFVPHPYPALSEGILGVPVVNLGCMNAGVDVFLNEPAVLGACRDARATVIQITGAQNLTNRYYVVHPRRNDRFVRATPALRTLYPGLDFTEFNFTRHMLHCLRRRARERFARVAADLRATWVERMTALIAATGGPVVLLWMADHAPPEPGSEPEVEADPMLVDAGMIAALRPQVSDVVVAVSSAGARAARTDGMVFGPLHRMAAAALPGPLHHEEAASLLVPVLRRVTAR